MVHSSSPYKGEVGRGYVTPSNSPSLGFPRPNVGPHGLEGVGGAFPFRAGENVGGRHQLYVSKTGLLDSIQVLSLQESAADSSGP